jgi:hypothetical protein
MNNSRRGFLRKGTLGALGIAAGLSLGNKTFGLAGLTSTGPRFALDKAAFQAHLNTEFLIGATKVAVKLIDILDLGSKRTANGAKEAFSLTFRGSTETTLHQDTFRIEHAKLGTFSLLLVPIVAKDKSSRYYEAVINQLHG